MIQTLTPWRAGLVVVALLAPTTATASPATDPPTAPAIELAQGAPPPPPAAPTESPLTAPATTPAFIPPPGALSPAPSKGLMIGGWVTFGVTYIASALAGFFMYALSDIGDDYCYACAKIGGTLLIPGVGPFVAMAYTSTPRERWWLALLGCGELAGLIMAIVGTAQYVAGMRRYRANLHRRAGFHLTDSLTLTAAFAPAGGGPAARVGLAYDF